MEIVKTLGQMVRFLPLATKGRDPMSVIRELARLGYVDQKSVSLFVNLRMPTPPLFERATFVYREKRPVSYLAAADVLNTQLREVLRRLEVDNPRKREWVTQ
jgi:hypothetical protein